MSTKEIWLGMPLSAGIQSQIMEFLWENKGAHQGSAIAFRLGIHKDSTSAALSNLRYAGWVRMIQQGMYEASDPRPVEDKTQLHHRTPRQGGSRTRQRPVGSVLKVGDALLLGVVLIDNKGPILQDDDTKQLYRLTRVEIR